ncbi:MAG: LysE family translocator, partial [Bryobacteraceae bacterium]
LPQFIDPARPALGQAMALASSHVAMGLAWLVLYARFLDRLGVFLTRPPVRRRFEQATGAVLVGLGLRLAWGKLSG